MLASLIFTIAAATTPPASSPVTAAPAPASTTDQAKLAEDQKVTCRMEASTGTMIADRVCHTNAQWREMSDEARQEMRENQNSAATPSGGGR